MMTRKFLLASFLTFALAGCGITTSNKTGDTPEGRAEIVEFVQPGETTLADVKARFGKPVATQGLGGDNFQANYASYFGQSGYVSVRYNQTTGVVFEVESYRFDAENKTHVTESKKS